MDFSTVYRRLEDNLYNDPEAFVRDVRLIFSNSRAYNTLPRSRVCLLSLSLLLVHTLEHLLLLLSMVVSSTEHKQINNVKKPLKD